MNLFYTAMAMLHAIETEVRSLETTVFSKLELRPEFRVLKTVIGIGDVLASTIMLETDTFRGRSQRRHILPCATANE